MRTEKTSDIHSKVPYLPPRGREIVKEITEPLTLHLVLHILRNPYGWSEHAQRVCRNWAADKLETISGFLK
jgi:hypothetical protein